MATAESDWAFFYKHLLIMRRSLAEMSWVLVYPFITLFSIGILTRYVVSIDAARDIGGFILVGTFVWTFYSLVQRAMTYGVMFDIWNRCIVHIIIAPRFVRSFLVGNALFGVASAVFTTALTGACAYVLFGFNILDAGWILPLALGIITLYAVAEGLVIVSFVLTRGYEYVALIWQVVGIIMILSGVYYPVSLFPLWLKAASMLLPHTHVLVAMRAVMFPALMDAEVNAIHHLGYGLLLSAVYLALGIKLFYRALDESRTTGAITDL